MITPRRTRLLRTPDLAGFRQAIVDVARGLEPQTAADAFVLVPTRAAADELRRTLEDRLIAHDARVVVLPLIGTRADLYATMGSRVPELPRMLTAFDRDVLLGAAARAAEDAGIRPPFHLRPGLHAEMLVLYDQIRRQHRSIADFDRLVSGELEPAAESDRGAAQLVDQTRFLVAAFEGYEVRLVESGGVDEHALRARLLATPALRPLRRAVIAVGDRVSDPDGLWPADVALLTTISGLEQLDILSTDRLLHAGYLDRLRLAFVGIEEVAAGPSMPDPVLVVPPTPSSGRLDALLLEYRDREDELEGVARRLKADRRTGRYAPLDRTALVVSRPLPYLYLARDVLGGAGIPFESLDTLPLAAEPYAAALDLVLEFVASEFTRDATTALLRSPHFRHVVEGAVVDRVAVAALDVAMADARYLGGLDRLTSLVDAWTSPVATAHRRDYRRRAALPAARAALAAACTLAPLLDTKPMAEHLARLQAFLAHHDRQTDTTAVDSDRRQRVRAAVTGALVGLGDAYRRHDPDASGTVHDVSAAIRRWLGAQTFAARTGAGGLHIVDPQAARFGDFDDVQLMGLVEGEWPERQRRNIFYPQALLAQLEPTRPERVEIQRERDLLRAGRAVFRDLVGLAAVRTRVSTFALEADAVVEPSVFVEDLATFGLATEIATDVSAVRVFGYEALALAPPALGMIPAPIARWARARLSAAGRDPSRFRGQAGPWVLPRVSVSRLEQYLKCPFQFYASNVLRLDEEPEDADSRSPLERGLFLHELFETFFREWQAEGRGRITPDSIAAARDRFAALCELALASLGPAEAAIERTRLLGSAVGAGTAERVLAMEAERPTDIRQRLLEYPLDGDFTFTARDGSTRVVSLRAKIDRVDLLQDGTFRLIDYKTRYVPDLKRALQLPIYSACVRDRLTHDHDRDVPPSEAMYLSFEGDKAVVALQTKGGSLDEAIADAEDRLIGALHDIAAGNFPPRPSPASLCKTCPFTTVCRDQGSGIGDQGSGIGDQGSGIGDQGSGIGDQGSGIGDQGSGIREPGS